MLSETRSLARLPEGLVRFSDIGPHAKADPDLSAKAKIQQAIDGGE